MGYLRSCRNCTRSYIGVYLMKKAKDSTLTKKLDDAFREYVWRVKPRTNCFICHAEAGRFSPKTNPQGLQVCHFISRSVYALRWDIENVELGCSRCNRVNESNTLPHTQAILREYGADHVDRLHTKWQVSKQRAKTFSRAEKLEMLEKFEKEMKGKHV